MRGLQSELLKYKRTFMGKLIVCAPIFFAVYALIMQATLMNNPLSKSHSWVWKNLLALIFNWWPFVFLPLGSALFATLVAAQEKKAGNYRALRVHDVSLILLWVNKVMAMTVYSLLSTVILAAAAVIIGVLSGAGAVPFGRIAAAGIVCWIASLALIPIQLWAATWRGVFLSMGIGFAGMIVGVLAASNHFWIVIPWSWATRLMCPIIGVHPNGVFLQANDPLLNASVIPAGILAALVTFVLGTAITALWFKRRETK